MNREQHEMALWAAEYSASRSIHAPGRAAEADAAVAQFRKRYPVEPTDDATGKAIAALLDDIAGDSAFSGFGQSMQSRIYAAIEAMRKGLPAAPAPVWYDEPPFEKDGKSHPCWVEGDAVHADVYWDDGQWWVWIVGSAYQQPLNGRPVSPIVKPPEPTT